VPGPAEPRVGPSRVAGGGSARAAACQPGLGGTAGAGVPLPDCVAHTHPPSSPQHTARLAALAAYLTARFRTQHCFKKWLGAEWRHVIS